MPKVSFVVPLYNKEAYISDCLEGLLAQTEKDIEIVVVDDGSTDDSKDIALFFASNDRRIKFFELGENKGRSYARNYGNSKAKAKIIAVQDADDISLPTRAEIIVKAFKKDIDVFYSAFYLDPQTMIEAKPLDREQIKETLYNFIGHSTMAYRKSLKPIYEEGKWSELGLDDWKLQTDWIAQNKKFYCVNEPLIFYRNVKGSISNTRDENEVRKTKREYLSGVNL